MSTEAITRVPAADSPFEHQLGKALVARVRKAARKWRETYERKVKQRMTLLKENRRTREAEERQRALKLARHVPMDLLAREWLNEAKPNVETRAYLVDKLLPTLIIAAEKLLSEVSKRGLERDDAGGAEFNPINFLAQYLMRNNPKFAHFTDASPYMRGIRAVADELKASVFAMEENRLAKIKAEARRQREERRKAEAKKEAEVGRRRDSLYGAFEFWLPGNGDVARGGVVLLGQVQACLKSFQCFTDSYPPELRKVMSFTRSLDEAAPPSDVALNKSAFAEYVCGFVSHFAPDVFDEFVDHLISCGKMTVASHLMEKRRETLSNVFKSCDEGELGILDRQKILKLFETFYDQASDETRVSLHNPRRWPVVEIFEEVRPDTASASVATEAEAIETEKRSATEEEKPQEIDKPEGGDENVAKTDDEKIDELEKTIDDDDGGPSLGVIREEDVEEKESKSSKEEISEKTSLPKVKLTDVEKEKEDETKEKQSGEPSPRERIGSCTSRFDLSSRGRPRTRSTVIGSVVLETAMDSSGPGSLFDPLSVNESQFVQLVETFLGDEPNLDLAAELGHFIQSEYGESAEDREAKRRKSLRAARSAHHRRLVDILFDAWDRNRSGLIELDELRTSLKKWKGIEAIADKIQERFLVEASEHKLSRKELRAYVELLAREYPEAGDAFDDIMQFLLADVELSIEERNRAEKRGKWLDTLHWTGKTSGINMDALYKGIFNTIQTDGDVHGDGKFVNASIGILEASDSSKKGEHVIRFIASTPDDREVMVGRRVTREMKNISFSVVDSGKPLHVRRVAAHGSVHVFGNATKFSVDEERDGSLVVLPLKNRSRRVFGVISIDTVSDPPGKTYQQHEISFYQGVAKALSAGYTYINIRLKTLRITQSAVAWIHRRCAGVKQVVAYLVEPSKEKSSESSFSLRKMLSTDERGESELLMKPPRLNRKDNLFRDYLFKCVNHSETVTSLAYGEHRIAYPLRDNSGYAIVVLDISLGATKALPPQQNSEMSRMLNLLSLAYAEVSQEVEEDEDLEFVLEAESVSEESRIAVMFDRMMLVELREAVEKLGPGVFAEMKSYVDPPKVVHTILQTLLTFFCSLSEDKRGDWNECKQLVTPDLLKTVTTFDPTSQGQEINHKRVAELLQDVPHGEVAKYGSLPAEYLYNWLYVCLSLVEHATRMGGYARST